MIHICSKCIEDQKLGPRVIEAQNAGVQFRQGLCPRHYVLSLAARGKSKKQIEVQVKYIMATFRPPPDLKKHSELIKQYKQGIFKEPLI